MTGTATMPDGIPPENLGDRFGQVLLVADWIAPLRATALHGNHYEPLVRGRAVPMHDATSRIDRDARNEFSERPTLFLKPSSAFFR